MHSNTSSAKLLLLPLLLFFAFFVFWYSTFRTCLKSLGPFTQSPSTIALYKSRGVRPSLIEDIFAKISGLVRVYIVSWCLEFQCGAISSGSFRSIPRWHTTIACSMIILSARHITLTLTKFIIPARMDTVVELCLVGSPEGQMGRSGVGRYFIFYAEILVYYCLSDLGLVFVCLPGVVVCVYWVGALMGVQNTLFYFESKISPFRTSLRPPPPRPQRNALECIFGLSL